MTEYDECQNCFGWCCVSFGIICEIKKDDITRIADYLDIREDTFIKNYLTEPVLHGGRTFRYTQPCYFWKHGRCSIHPVKPRGCAKWEPLKSTDGCSEYHKQASQKPQDRYSAWKFEQIELEISDGKNDR